MKKPRKRALITGITGQDGSYLAEYLISLNYDVWGIMRRTSLDPLMRLKTIVRSSHLHLLYGNLRDSAAIARALKEARPDEIYNLAAQSDVGISFLCPEETWEVNYTGAKRLIREAMRLFPKVRIYHASTSEMFGNTPPPQNEHSAFMPVSPYGKSKLKAYRELVKGYRTKHKIFICSGILFNHESPRRGEHFVTRKTTLSLAHIKLGLQKSFALGNLEAKRDWGFAGDSVRAMHLMLQQKTPKDYVIATSESHTVREFVEAVAKELGMTIRWSGRGVREVGKDTRGRTVVRVDKKFFRPSEVRNLRGDASSARKDLKWKPRTSFKQLVRMMVSADLKKVRQQMH